jgi:hypothetical protein
MNSHRMECGLNRRRSRGSVMRVTVHLPLRWFNFPDFVGETCFAKQGIRVAFGARVQRSKGIASWKLATQTRLARAF